MTINLQSILLIGSLLASLGLLGKVGCSLNEKININNQLNKELMQANLDKGRALTEFGEARAKIGETEPTSSLPSLLPGPIG